MGHVTLRQEDPAQPDIVALLREGEAESARLYPTDSNHHLPLDALRATEVRFMVVRDRDDHPLATGALVLHGDWAEIKRMWVVEQARGRGLSKLLLDSLVLKARSESVRALRLETGVSSHAALNLYKRAGFQPREAFGTYKADPFSVFMEKHL